VAQSDAVVAVGGGAGTLSEMAFAWIRNRLVVAMEVDGWSGEMAGRKIDDRSRSPAPEDDRVFAASNAAEALEVVEHRLKQYGGAP
jgi:predicted Rossmann-fold nucleotide-binding protein